MAKGVLVVQSSPTSPEQAEEYDRWYDEVHLPEVLAYPGFVSARRLKAVETPGGDSAAYRENITIYEIDADDVVGAMKNLFAGFERGELTPSDALQTDPIASTQLYQLHYETASTSQ